MTAATWHGSDAMRDRLLFIINKNCECTTENRCASHQMLVAKDAQRVLDHLLFAYSIRARLVLEERFILEKKTPRTGQSPPPRRGRRGPRRALPQG